LVDLFESLVCVLIEIKRSTKIVSRLITKPKHAVTNELQRAILYLVT